MLLSRPARLLPTLLLPLLLCQCDCEVEPLSDIPIPGQISGRVCDPGQSEGIFGATVYVIVDDAGGARRVETLSLPDGSFVIPDVPPGEYTVYVQRGSFRTEVPEVFVEEDTETILDDSACIAPNTVDMIVYDGHDNVQEVLERLGYSDFEVVPTHSRFSDRDDTTPSWLVEAFGELSDFADHDILFINCGPHEWALDRASPDEVEQVLTNLRSFVARGGSIYFSDWSYDLLELMYPDAVDWRGDDTVRNDAERAIAQDFLGRVLDPVIASTLGIERASLRFNQSRIATPAALGEGTTALIVGNLDVEEEDGTIVSLQDVPVLLQHVPPAADPEQAGRIIFTTFHNGASNTADMDEVLRAIIFSL